MNIWFRFSVWIGKKFKIEGAPLCRVFNDARSESYTLTNDGMVLIQGVKSKAIDVVPLSLCSESLAEKFSKALNPKKAVL